MGKSDAKQCAAHQLHTEKPCTWKFCQSHSSFSFLVTKHMWIFECLEKNHCDKHFARLQIHHFIPGIFQSRPPISRHFTPPPSESQVTRRADRLKLGPSALVPQQSKPGESTRGQPRSLGGAVGGGAKPEVYTPEAGGALGSPRWSDPTRSL